MLDALLGLGRGSKVTISMLGDLICMGAAFSIVMLKASGTQNHAAPSEALGWWFVFSALAIAFAWRLGLYRAVLRYAGVRVLWVVGLSVALAGLGLGLLQSLLGFAQSPTQYVALAIIAAAFSAGGRILAREAIFQSARLQKSPVVIYGAGDSGRQLLTAIAQSQSMRAVAMIDDAQVLHGSEFHGVRVYPPQALAALCAEYEVQTVILAMPLVSRTRRAHILQRLEKLPVKVRSMPRITDILAGRRQVLDLQEVSIEELLGRDPVAPLKAVMDRAVFGWVVCVTGAGGSIGSELVRQLLRLKPKKLVLVEQSEFALYEVLSSVESANASDVELVALLQSVTDREAMRRIFSTHAVQLLFHAAAYKHVPLVESNPFMGVFNNVFGTQATLKAAIDAQLESVVLVSTDKAVRPTNVMGATKRIAELIAQGLSLAQSAQSDEGRPLGPVISMVRFGNVLSSSGSVIPRFQAQIRAGGPLTVTHPEITRYFMTIPEAVELVIQTSGMAKGGDVFLLDMGEPVRILDLATRMVRLSGFKPVIGDTQKAADPSAMPIVFSGLRPGEKLYEELLIDARAQATEHPMIHRASERALAPGDLERLLARLERACHSQDLHSLTQIFVDFDIGYEPGLGKGRAPQKSANELAKASDLEKLAIEQQDSLKDSPKDSLKGGGDDDGEKLHGVEPLNKRTIHPLLSKALHLFFLLTRPLTMGARAIVVNAQQEVLLVKHRYESGWQLPGGGIEIGESALDALRREVREEAGVEILGQPQLVGSFHNRDVSVRDHVLVYRCDRFKLGRREHLSGEIAQCAFFPLHALPEDTTPGTRRRLAECFDGHALEASW